MFEYQSPRQKANIFKVLKEKNFNPLSSSFLNFYIANDSLRNKARISVIKHHSKVYHCLKMKNMMKI